MTQQSQGFVESSVKSVFIFRRDFQQIRAGTERLSADAALPAVYFHFYF